jgi:flagellar biosynthesis protein FlhA
MGLGLVKFVGGGQDSPLIKRIAGIRRQFAGDMGFLLGPVRVVDNVALKANEYVISLKGAEIARYELPAGLRVGHPGGQGETAGKGGGKPPANRPSE